MSQTITIPYGERLGLLLHVSEVDRGLECDCICPVCKVPLVARKGIKTTHHFAHGSGSTCSAETVLHELGKRLLHARLSLAILSQEPVNITWSCESCPDKHAGNLVKRAASVKLEQLLGSCRPDIMLYDSGGLAVALVEIVVSHSPEDNVRTYAAAKGLPIVEFHLKTYDDLERLQHADVLTPTRVDLCTRPKCRHCGDALYQKRLHVVDAPCWKCDRPMKVAMLDIDGILVEGPQAFSDEEVAIARQRGALLKENNSKTLRERYLSNTCPHCHAFVGSFFMHHYWNSMSPENGNVSGYTCMGCCK